MKAWRLTAAKEPLQLFDIPDPEAGANEIVVDVKAAGICHTDTGYLDGTLTEILGFTPITLGHEIAGIISQLGKDVAGFEIGQKVVIPASVPGPGTGTDGGFADKVKAFDYQVVPLPDGIPWEQAAPATDAGMTSYHALKRGGVKAGTRLGIIGAGGLGSLAIQFAKGLGAEVYVAETNHDAWDRISALGVDGLVENIREVTDKELEVIVDYAGFGTTTDDAIEAVGVNGTVVQVGMGVGRADISTTSIMLKQVNLLGSLGGTNEDAAEVLEMMAAGKVSSEVEVVSFDDIDESIKRFERGDATKGRLVAVRD
jgi:propanol-preferring alcohol dehydrogenase